MRIPELKQRIGIQAKQIITSECGLKTKNNNYSCPITKHNKDNCSVQWYNNSFSLFCHDCGKSYDIIDHARTKHNMMEYLHNLAGITYQKKEFPLLKPITTKLTTMGEKYLKSRGISDKTIRDYRIRSDDKYLYFHYATPDNKLVKIKKREISQKKFVAEKGGTEILFGLHLLETQNILIICEGETDCISMYEITCLLNKENEVLCTSVPNGASSLNQACIDNCSPYLDQFQHIVIVPHNDNAGKKMKDSALNLLGQYRLEEIVIPDNINDANDYFLNADHNSCDIFKYSKKLIPPLNGVSTAKDIIIQQSKDGYRSGFITYDYNDNGIKEGSLIVLTGKRGDGKTTVARQVSVSLARQNINSFIFEGETTIQKQKEKLARLTAEKGEIIEHLGIAGNKRYLPSLQAIKRFDDNFSKHIYCMDKNKLPENDKFNFLLAEMRKMAISYDVKLFVLDNLMVLCEQHGARVFTEQKNIVITLKAFAEETKTGVILIAHPKKENQKIVSGAAEVENMPDTILRYIRLEDEQKEQLLKKYPDISGIIERASARIKVEKIRDDGNKKISWLEWDSIKGAVYDISDLSMAKMYEEWGYWTRAL